MANARLGWFSPLGLAASIRASARWLAFGLTASAFRHAPLRSCRWASSFFRLPFRRLPLGGFVLPPSASEIALRGLAFGLTASAFRHAPIRRLPLGGLVLPLGELAFGLTASAFRHAPLRGCRSAGWPSGSRLPHFGTRRFGNCPRRVRSSAGRVGLRAHCFRFSARPASEIALGGLAFGLPLRRFRSAGWPSGSPLPLFGMRRLGVAARRVGLRVHGFRFSARIASELPSASWFFCLLFRRLPLGELVLLPSVSEFAARRVGLRAHGFRFSARTASELPSASWRFRSAGWPSGSRLLLFGMRRSAPPRRRREDRRSTTTRQLFHFKTLIPTC